MSGDARAERVRMLFAAAIEAGDDLRDAVLAGEPDAAVLDEVLELLRFAGAGGNPLDAWRVDSRELLSALQDGLRPWPDPPPESIGPYRIAGLLGAGSMGTVFLGERAHPPGKVAVKLLRPWLGRGEALRRFELEVEILARLDHPHIARILDAGRAEVDGVLHPFLVLEHIRGVPLHVWAREHRADRPASLALFLALCDAVAHAHARGVIHRDLKPTNVLVDERGEPHVLDFGVSRLAEETLQATRMLTAMGQVIGTLEYMSPEQARGRPSDVDTRSDVYALGVILYELLTGHRPFDFEGLSLPECLRRIAEGAPAPLRPARPGERRVPSDLETIVGKALAKDRGRRYATVRELAHDVERFLADEPISARPPSSFYLARMYARRHPVLSTALASGLAAATVAGAGVFLGWREASAQARLAEEQAALAREQTELAQEQAMIAREQTELAEVRLSESRAALAEADSLTQVLAQVIRAPDVRRDGRDPPLSEVVATLGADIEEHFRDQPRARGPLRYYLAESLESMARFDEAEVQADGARADLQAAGLAGTDLGYHVEDLRARLFAQTGRYAEARDLYRATQAELATARGDADPLTARAQEGLGTALVQLGDYPGAEEALRAAVLLRERSAGPDAAETLLARAALQRPLALQGRYDEVIATLEDLLPALRAACAGEPHRLLDALGLLAEMLDHVHRYDRALELHREEVEISERTFGEDSVATWRARLSLLFSLHGLRATEEGLALAREIHAWMQAHLDPEDSTRIFATRFLGVFLCAAGQLDEGVAAFQDALSAAEATDRGEWTTGIAVDLRIAIGNVTLLLGRPEQAVEVLEPALATVEGSPAWSASSPVHVRLALTKAYLASGRSGEGVDLARRAFELALGPEGEPPWLVAELVNDLAAFQGERALWTEMQALLAPLAEPLHANALAEGADARARAATAWLLLGRAEFELGRADGAERALERADVLLAGLDTAALPAGASARDLRRLLGKEAGALEPEPVQPAR